MSAYIYHGRDLRCRISPGSDFQYELQLQKHLFWFLWLDVDSSVMITEDLKPEKKPGTAEHTRHFIRINPRKMDFMYSGYAEFWAYGTLDIKARAELMLTEYINKCEGIEISKQRVNSTLNSI